MKFLSIAIKDLKELLRDRRGLFFILLFPLFFMLIFGFAFGGMGQGTTSYKLAIVNYDQPATIPGLNQSTNFGDNLTKDLKDAKYQNSSVNLFNVTVTSESDADQKLKNREVDAELIIPSTFSQSVVALINNTIQTTTNPLSTASLNSSSNLTTTLIIRGDPGYINFGASQGILSNFLSGYKDQIVIQTQNGIRNTPGAQPVQFLDYKIDGIGTKNFTTFDYMAPGIIVFAILMMAINVAALFAREVENGTLRRLRISKMTSFDYLFGGLLPWSLVVAAQVLILFTVAIAIGFHWQGNVNSIILAVIVGIIGGIASIALGMIIAAFAKSPPQASQLGTLIAVPVSFLSGAFIPLPQVVVGSIMGQQVFIYDILPWYHVVNILRNVLTFGKGWADISNDVAITMVLTVILFVIGVLAFSRTRLRAES